MNGNTIKKHTVGFTFIEVLVTVVLVTVGIVAAMGGIRAVSQAEVKSQTADLLQNLAAEKLNELTLTIDPTQNGTAGDFSDRGHPDITWNLQIQTTALANVDEATVTATRGRDSQSLATQIYVPPTTTTATGTAGATP
jgi:Tfp pilus assembly protein PilV